MCIRAARCSAPRPSPRRSRRCFSSSLAGRLSRSISMARGGSFSSLNAAPPLLLPSFGRRTPPTSSGRRPRHGHRSRRQRIERATLPGRSPGNRPAADSRANAGWVRRECNKIRLGSAVHPTKLLYCRNVAGDESMSEHYGPASPRLGVQSRLDNPGPDAVGRNLVLLAGAQAVQYEPAIGRIGEG